LGATTKECRLEKPLSTHCCESSLPAMQLKDARLEGQPVPTYSTLSNCREAGTGDVGGGGGRGVGV
jgi:hypothetical protein